MPFDLSNGFILARRLRETIARLGFVTFPARRPPSRHRRGTDGVPADLVDRPPHRGGVAPGLHRREGEGVRDRDPGRRDPRRVLGVPRAASRACSADCSAIRARIASWSTSSIAFAAGGRARVAPRPATSRRALFAPVPVAIAFVVGAFVILWVERRQRARPDTVRIDDIDAMRWTDALKVGCAQAFALDPGHVALGCDDHRRHAVRPVAARGHRVLVLPRDPDAVRRVRVRGGEEPPPARRSRSARRSASASRRRSCPRSCACAGSSAS